jgi:outer membrane protein OmpA-like peptidoglycan-associated protein
MAFFKPAHLFRALRAPEVALAREVFHHALPPLNTIGITDGLGKDNQIWTVDRAFFEFLQSGPPKSLARLRYLLNFGEAVHWDLSTPKSLSSAVPGYPERARDIFIHEMTHVWQFNRGVSVKADSLLFGHYDYSGGDPWIRYDVEHQASIVERWNKERKGAGEDHEFFPYIHYIIRQEGEYKPSNKLELWMMDLPQLAVLLMGEKGFGVEDENHEPVRVTSQDDSMLVVLDGGILFDFDKAILKPQADAVLQRAAATIKAKSGPRLRAVLVNGHTDSVGDAGYNMGLSERRAKTVASWFISRGYLSSSITRPQGFGETQPIAPNTNAANRAKNRRVEIYLMNN